MFFYFRNLLVLIVVSLLKGHVCNFTAGKFNLKLNSFLNSFTSIVNMVLFLQNLPALESSLFKSNKGHINFRI